MTAILKEVDIFYFVSAEFKNEEKQAELENKAIDIKIRRHILEMFKIGFSVSVIIAACCLLNGLKYAH